MKLARVKVTYELLEQAIGLPEGVKIRRAFPPNETVYMDRMLEVVLEGEILPVDDIREGEGIPHVLAVEEDDPDGMIIRQPRLRFEAY